MNTAGALFSMVPLLMLKTCLGLGSFFLLAELLFKLKQSIKKPLNLLALVLIASAFTLFSEYRLNASGYHGIIFLLLSGLYVELVMTHVVGNRLFKLAAGGSYLLVYFHSEFVLSLFVLSIFGESVTRRLMEEGWLVDDLLRLALFLLLLYVKKQRTKKDYDFPVHLIVLPVFISANCLVLALLFFLERELLILLPIALLLFLFYSYLKLSKQAYQENYHYQVKEQKQRLIKEHYQKIDDFHEEIQQLQHKMHVQLMTMQQQAERNEFPQMASQLAGMIEENISVESQWFTSHKEMNVLVGHKCRQAQAAGIKFQSQINIPMSLPISEIDLISLVSNLLDNAIEACSFCSSEESWMKFQMVAQKQCLVVQLENSTDDQHQSFKTRKPDKLQHGLGLKSVQRIVKKYNGEIAFDWEDHAFSIEITLFI